MHWVNVCDLIPFASLKSLSLLLSSSSTMAALSRLHPLYCLSISHLLLCLSGAQSCYSGVYDNSLTTITFDPRGRVTRIRERMKGSEKTQRNERRVSVQPSKLRKRVENCPLKRGDIEAALLERIQMRFCVLEIEANASNRCETVAVKSWSLNRKELQTKKEAQVKDVE